MGRTTALRGRRWVPRVAPAKASELSHAQEEPRELGSGRPKGAEVPPARAWELREAGSGRPRGAGRQARRLCASDCGRPRAEGFKHCCRTCIATLGQEHGPKCEAAHARSEELPQGGGAGQRAPKAAWPPAWGEVWSREDLLRACGACSEGLPGAEAPGGRLLALPGADAQEADADAQKPSAGASDAGAPAESAFAELVLPPTFSRRAAGYQRAREAAAALQSVPWHGAGGPPGRRAAWLACEAAWAEAVRLQEARDPFGHVEAIKTKEAWRDWMVEPARVLEQLQNAEYKITKAWDFQCIVCRVVMTSGAKSHLCGQKHWKELAKQASHAEPWSVCGLETQWVQAFKVSDGRHFLLNHLTGEVSWDDSGQFGRVADAATEAKSTPAEKPEASRESEVLLKAALVESADVAAPTGYNVFGGWQYWGAHSLLDPCRPWADQSSRHKFGWDPKVRNTWSLEWKTGTWLLVLGFVDRVEGGRKQEKIAGTVNGIEFEAWKGVFLHREVELVVTLSPSSQRFRVEGRCAPLLRYVHVLDASASGSTSEWTRWTAPRPPPFQPDCHGVPADWNVADAAPRGSPEAGLFWGRRARKQLWGSEAGGATRAQADINAMLEFLRAREGPGGESVLSLLGPPLKQEDGWYSLQWRQFDRARQREDGRARWVRAWHGCKLEALYSILYHGRLRASCDKSMGDRYFDGAPGIYVHKDATSRKAENYVRFVHLCGDGVFWAAKWEVVVDRRQSVAAPHQTDQWVQREDGVHLAALWVCGRAAEAMHPGDAVSREWRGELEANPKDPCWG